MDFSCLCFDGGLWKQKERYNEGINQEYYCNLNLAVSASISFSSSTVLTTKPNCIWLLQQFQKKSLNTTREPAGASLFL